MPFIVIPAVALLPRKLAKLLQLSRAMRIAVFESEVVVICSSTVAEEDKQQAPTVSIATDCRLVFELEALVTLVSVVTDGAPLLFPIPSSYFADLLSFGLPPLQLPEALFF